MRLFRLRHRFAVASSVGAAALAATLMLGGGVASAATIPAFPTVGAYPEFFTAGNQMSNVVHSEGSDTTLYVMQTLGDLYTNSGLFPFGCQPYTVTLASCETPTQNSGLNPNNVQTDTTDNFNSNEILQGINNVGSGNGQTELCGGVVPVNTTVDFARSSKPAGTISGCPMVQLGYAKDSVPAVVFNSINPHAYGTPSGYNSIGSFISYNQTNGATITTPFPSGGIGPVAQGWLPGDPYTCVANDGSQGSGTPCSGTPVEDFDNTGGLTSVAYRLWCAHGSSTTANQSQIMDWGNLTNLTGSEVIGQGAPIGVPIRIIGVNAGSGTAATFNNFAKSGSGTNCTSSGSNFNLNAASGANPQTAQGPGPANPEIALENDASQIGDFASANWGPTDAADQATDIATSIYYMGFGAYNTNAIAPVATLEVNSGVIPSGLPGSFTESFLAANGIEPSIATELSNQMPVARTLFNIYRSDKIRASTAGFLNWICDTNPSTSTSTPTYSTGGQVSKGLNHIDGGNYDTDLTNVINGQYGFARLTDASPELQVSQQITGNGVTNPNASCDAQAAIGTGGITSGTNVVTLAASTVPSTIQVGWEVATAAGYNSQIKYPVTTGSVTTTPATTITGIGVAAGLAANQIKLSSNVSSAGGSVAPSTLYFPGHPPILSVHDPNS